VTREPAPILDWRDAPTIPCTPNATPVETILRESKLPVFLISIGEATPGGSAYCPYNSGGADSHFFT
jgi:hypothetical protein